MIVVVGDALLDVDLVGTASRLTPGAPVPVSPPAHLHRRATARHVTRCARWGSGHCPTHLRDGAATVRLA